MSNHLCIESCIAQAALRDNDIVIHGGEQARHALGLPLAPAPKMEYGTRDLTLELVSSMDEAIDHIHEFGSSHTEAIVTGQSQSRYFFQYLLSLCICVALQGCSHLIRGTLVRGSH